MFLTPWENPIGILLICVIFALFFILLYWSLRKDKQDKLLVSLSQSVYVCEIISRVGRNNLLTLT